NDCIALRRDPIDGRRRETSHRHCRRPNLCFLGVPFFGYGRRQRPAWCEQIALAWRLDWFAVESNGVAASSFGGLGLSIEPLHHVTSSSAKGSSTSPAKPKNSQVRRICGGSGAVNCSCPPSGCGMERALA